MIKKRSEPHKQKKKIFHVLRRTGEIFQKKKLYQQKNKFDKKNLLDFK